jgi:REP element-mobilizing transposase RayT
VVTIDRYVVMPNHVHAIVGLGETGEVELGDVVGAYKAAVSRTARTSRIWQRGYHDHIIRDESDLERIREYIETNPIRWALDPENPNRRS